MRTLLRGVCCSLACCLLLAPKDSLIAASPIAERAAIKPEVIAMVRDATEAYKKMKSYEHTAILKETVKTAEGERSAELKYKLALVRPNKFCYKSIGLPLSAAVSNGKTFTNYRNEQEFQNQYVQTDAPAKFTGINIVDDVTFRPLGTYVIALMLQGDPLADKDVKASLEKATILPPVTEDGRKMQVLHILFGPESVPFDLYFEAGSHLLSKASRSSSDGSEVERIEERKVDKDVDAEIFEYTPPPAARRVEKFTPPQRPDDA